RPGRKHWTRNERNDAKKQPIITVSNAHSAIGKRKVSTMANGTTSVVPVKRMATHGSSAMVSCIRIVQLDKSAASPPARPMVTGVQPGGPAVQLISLVTGESVRASKVAATASIVTPAAPRTSSTRVCSSCGYVTRLDHNEIITILRLQIIRDDDIDSPHLIHNDYSLEFRPTSQHANCDSLSRLPLPRQFEEEPAVNALLLNEETGSAITAKAVARHTRTDAVLGHVLRC
uniref:Uncharacterized protein n=1 Tax=Macrostomum lignano TaxID=282301 RepID=A0A1I8GN48_9PLAT